MTEQLEQTAFGVSSRYGLSTTSSGGRSGVWRRLTRATSSVSMTREAKER